MVAIGLYLYRTRPGLHLRAVGEDPKSADAMGVSVARYRYAHTMVGGALAGVAGAYYTLAIAPGWVDNVTAGAGWIAIALVISSLWRPGLLLAAAYLFGIVTSLGFTLQARGVDLRRRSSAPFRICSRSSPLWLSRAAGVEVCSIHRPHWASPTAVRTPEPWLP